MAVAAFADRAQGARDPGTGGRLNLLGHTASWFLKRGGLIPVAWVVAVAGLVFCLVEMAQVLGSPPHFVLAVETSGPSTAVVTSHHPERLRRLAGQVTYAIENPQAEFQVRVDTIRISPSHYCFGDNVNMHGGTRDVGIDKRRTSWS